MKSTLAHWDIEYSVVDQLKEKVWRIDDQFILKGYDDQYGIETNIGIMKALKHQGLHVPEILTTRQEKAYLEMNDHYYMLIENMQGRHLTGPELLNDTALSYHLGEVMAKLHIGLKQVEDQYDFYDNHFMEEMNGWITDKLVDSEYFSKGILTQLKAVLEDLIPTLERQPIHRDFHLNNMVFSEEHIAFIDFDISQSNIRIFDLAYFCVGLLAEHFDEASLRQQWSQSFEAVVKGYHAVSPLTLEERQGLKPLMVAIEVLFVAFFQSANNLQLANAADRVCQWLWQEQMDE